MEKFVGTYKFESSENFEKILIKLDFPQNVRTILGNGNATIAISDNRNGSYTIQTTYPKKTYSFTFRLGQDVMIDQFTKVNLTLDGEKLVEIKTFPQVSKDVVEEIFTREDDYLHLLIKIPSMTSKVCYKKL